MNFDYGLFLNQTAANIISAVILTLLGLVFIDQKRILRPWVYKFLNKTVANYLIRFLNFILHPYFRLLIAIALLFIIFKQTNNIILPLSLLIILLTLILPKRKTRSFLPFAKYQDDFATLEDWQTSTGRPAIEPNFGKPAPDLGLVYVTNQATSSFITHKQISRDSGIIECDFYLEADAVFNIVFLADQKKHNWYMARFDSRDSASDGFIIKDLGPGNNWKLFKMSGTQTSVRTWHRARVEFNSERVAMYKNGDLLVEFSNPQLFGKSIGLFNELAHVHVDNFSFIEN